MPGELDADALGYLHANCSHCHNPDRRADDAAPRCFTPDVNLDFTLPAAVLARVEDAPAVQTAGSRLTGANSEIVERMSGRNDSFFPSTMPPLGTEEVDAEGVALIREWAAGL